ncbi:DUF2243 domain-containing protein [Halorussus limi]|uniref:DUF2243 domain-containing protein n=1 Tax=Halorussus limi TaxID=2938695 RepID=A0A8U0HXA0_9EURY|nr:DUF2243 domain-containing protein [Halorussus limi]UPV75547.1 DUF2243 domain-containing protein [Halorussus limi]
MARPEGERTVLFGAGVFGFGSGALLDVLVFHLIFQWHHLLSDFFTPNTLAGLRTNIYYDGLFSLAMVGVMAVGMGAVWRELNRASESHSAVRALGAIFVGAGLFNLFDGIVDHYVLGIHDVVHGTQAFNPHWVGASLLLLGAGILAVTR